MSPLRSTVRTICLIVLLIPVVVFAQDKKTRKGANNSQISQETRINSALYADGIRAFYSKNFSKSEEIFRLIITQDPENDASFFMLSRIKEEQKDIPVAISYISQAIEINNQNIWYQVALANLYDQIGDYKNSEKTWKKVCNNVTNNEYYLYSLANALLKNEKYEEVIKIFDQMEEIIGMNYDLTETKKNIWLYLNKVDNAVSEYQKLIQIYPYEIKYYVIIGQIYMVNGLNENALDYYKKAETIDSMSIQLLIAYIDYYNDNPDQNLKSQYLNKLFSIPDQYELINPIFVKEIQKIQKSKQKDQIFKGIQYCESFINANSQLGDGYGYLAQLYLLLGDSDKAFEYSGIAIQKNDQHYESWHIYISNLFKKEQYQEIILKTNDIEALFPTQSYLLSLLGYSYYKTEQYDKATIFFQNSLEYSYENQFSAEISVFLGDIYVIQNRKEDALKYFRLAQRYGDNSSELIDKINKIQ